MRHQLKVHLMSQSEVPYSQLAKRLKISESALRTGVHRFRQFIGTPEYRNT